MRIERIQVESFGRLKGLDTGPRPLGDLVVVLGPNEAGKSTLFAFLTTALYGFHPASRETNPHLPWGADEAAGAVHLALGDDGCVLVERRLRSAATGTLVRNDVRTDLRNQPVPWVEHVPRSVFREVYAVTLADVATLDRETWAGIQDRIVGSMGSSGLRPARAVAEALEREASEIWRPNRRGNQRLRDLQDEGRRLRGRRQSAMDRDRTIRALVDQRDVERVRLQRLREERHEHRLAVERIQSLAPLRRALHRIEGLRAKGGDREDLHGLPSDPGVALADGQSAAERATERLAALDHEGGEADRVRDRFGRSERELLARRDEVARFLALAADVAPDRRRARELSAEVAELRVALDAAGARLLVGGWDEELATKLLDVSIPILEDRVARLATLASRGAGGVAQPGDAPHRVQGEARARATSIAQDAGPPVIAVAAMAAGVLLLVWAGSGGPAWALPLGTAFAAAGAVGALARSRPARGPVRDEQVSEAARLRAEAARLRNEIVGMLRGLPLRSELLEPPAQPLVSGLTRLQELNRRLDEGAEALRRGDEHVARADDEALTLARSLGRDEGGDAATFAAVVDRAVRDAERLRDAAENAERDLRRIAREREACRNELAGLSARIVPLLRALSDLGGGDARAGADAARFRMEAHHDADRLSAELERAHPDLAERIAQIEACERAGEPWTIDDGDLARRGACIEELDTRIEQSIAADQALDRDAAHLRELETVDAVDSEILSRQEEEASLTRERDRKWVLAQLIREADRRFREEHQPDLIRRASKHLARLTGGRYDRLLVDETRADGAFLLMGPALPAPILLAAPVSTGTLEQAYLGLRLAIVDHLDQERERLPLFIDEALVNWDLERRDRGLDVLADISSSRQLFVFTCHEAIAERLQQRGARVLRLGRDE